MLCPAAQTLRGDVRGKNSDSFCASRQLCKRTISRNSVPKNTPFQFPEQTSLWNEAPPHQSSATRPYALNLQLTGFGESRPQNLTHPSPLHPQQILPQPFRILRLINPDIDPIPESLGRKCAEDGLLLLAAIREEQRDVDPKRKVARGSGQHAVSPVAPLELRGDALRLHVEGGRLD